MTRTQGAIHSTNSSSLGPAFRKNGNQETCGVQRDSVVLRLADASSGGSSRGTQQFARSFPR